MALTSAPSYSKARTNVSFAILSSFWIVSPWTFTDPVVPKTLISPARLRSRLMSLPAMASCDINRENSPVAGGCVACSCRRCRVSVSGKSVIAQLSYLPHADSDYIGFWKGVAIRVADCAAPRRRSIDLRAAGPAGKSLEESRGNRADDDLGLHQHRQPPIVIGEPYPDIAFI